MYVSVFVSSKDFHVHAVILCGDGLGSNHFIFVLYVSVCIFICICICMFSYL